MKGPGGSNDAMKAIPPRSIDNICALFGIGQEAYN